MVLAAKHFYGLYPFIKKKIYLKANRHIHSRDVWLVKRPWLPNIVNAWICHGRREPWYGMLWSGHTYISICTYMWICVCLGCCDVIKLMHVNSPCMHIACAWIVSVRMYFWICLTNKCRLEGGSTCRFYNLQDTALFYFHFV